MKKMIFMIGFLALLYLFSVVILNFCKKGKTLSISSVPISKDISLACKGIAITLIMMSHIANAFGVRYMTPLGSFGVAVFLFLSGYGLQLSAEKNGVKGYWLKRLKVAYLPYLVIEVFGYIFLYSDFTFIDVILDLLLIDTMHPYGWYMQCLFLYYIAFYIAELLSKKKRIFKYVVLGLSAIAMFIFLGGLFKQQVFSFTLGVVYAINRNRLKFVFEKQYFALMFLFSGVGMLALRQIPIIRESHWVVYNTVYALQAVLLALALVAIVSIFSKFFKNVNQLMLPFIFIGMISNELYLVHAFCIPQTTDYFSIAIFFVVAFIICSAIYFAKTYIQKYLSLVLKKRGSNVK